MPWDGSGNFNLLYDFRTDLAGGPPNSFVRASRVMEQLEDMEAAVNECLNRNGENAMTDPLPMGGNRIENLGDATAAIHAPTARQVSSGALVWASTFTGSTTSLWAVTKTFAPAAYGAGLILCGLAPNTNAGALNVILNAISEKNVFHRDGSELEAGDIPTGTYFEFRYDGTQFVVVHPQNAKTTPHGAASTVFAQLALKAVIASPTFTGVPAAPTAAAETSTTQLATTEFVQQELLAGLTALQDDSAGIKAGEKMLFYKATAPTGWTKDTDVDDAAIRISDDAGGDTGGTAGFQATFASRTPAGTVAGHALTIAQMPAHTHTQSIVDVSGGGVEGGGPLGNASTVTGSTGGGAAHDHGWTGTAMDFAVKYANFLKCTKD